ncbi:MAG: hypothetical protein NT129_04030 [Candidatus Aenigmarchaeota archaeon]|nr:hypothetical protein [Candidatus Aenigmarchaeota archaeon]
MVKSMELTLYALEPIAKVIEAVVTNNLGYTPDRERPFKEDCNGKYRYEDGTEVNYGHEHLNLQWHLGKLQDAHVLLNWDLESKRHLPIIDRQEYVITELPPQSVLTYLKLEPSQKNFN